MSSPERMALMERNISRLALLIQELGEFELDNLQWRARWERRMQENDERMRENDEEIRRLNEQSAAHAAKLQAMLEVVVEIQTDVARIDAAS